MGKRWLRDDLPVLGLYLALTLGLTYPLITNFSTHVPGTNVDEYTFLWNIWWFKHALFDLGLTPSRPRSRSTPWAPAWRSIPWRSSTMRWRCH